MCIPGYSGPNDLSSITDISQHFSRTYKAIDDAQSTQTLDEISKQCQELINFASSLSWSQKFGTAADEMQALVVSKSAKVEAMLNRRAKELGSPSRFMATTGNISDPASTMPGQETGIHGSRIDPVFLE
jgi:hypothetical protein